ncbi:hypothetical protein LV84_03123 [Algoriphagus ratkowskyi]|uniref:Uncharacterized protein n=1 Tax=Algoriphagus ratkowskyi TaxID=57028 RepID=A0A2W7RGH8_9BACT|nr:hypothetical protein [Algoriphagus ratkowskyi]PZX53399.1 hypothetical protein LV84_03123 [Algoriphagus ratkowskyi]TXD76555.1 hypothetical protein ESW18_16275 [Algoriphagus ratkowskyi]
MPYQTNAHSFHIPVMGLGYTVDTPIKVAKYGISSVVSIMDDHLLEDMRKIYSKKYVREFIPISDTEEDYRAKRITAYLDLTQSLVEEQFNKLINEDWSNNTEFRKYLDLLPENTLLINLFEKLETASESQKFQLKEEFKSKLSMGAVDVNIMTKIDKINHDKSGNELPREYSDALSALRGFALSKANGSVVFSAGMNPSLYGYAEQFSEFYPNQFGEISKGIILKVSDYRSALIQGKFLAKKGLWVSEFRIESGLNCGGHAFATDGFLIGPILEEFKTNRSELFQTLYETCQSALQSKEANPLSQSPTFKITYQGGIGTATEDSFLREYYELDGTGWGSPFLLVPEATSVDDDTLERLFHAKKSDYYLSHASPLGVPFNNLRTSSGEEQRMSRIEKNRSGSPCYKKFLMNNTEFTDKPICTASRQYQNLKAKQFEAGEIDAEEIEKVKAKDCLCEGLSAPAILAAGEMPRRNLKAVTICPGPNLAYFKGSFTLKEMADHIYGKLAINMDLDRPHVFVKELQLYVSYLKKEFDTKITEKVAKREVYLEKFRNNLIEGVSYYQEMISSVQVDSDEILQKMKGQFHNLKNEIEAFSLTLKAEIV